MYNKIQPQQIQLHNFSSPSGNIIFSQGADFVYGDLNPSITGNINILGSLNVNNSPVPSADSSNTISSNKNNVFNGYSNTVYGTGNLILNSSGTYVLGLYNIDLNGRDNYFSDTSAFCSILAGKNASTVGDVTGAVILKDYTVESYSVDNSHSLNIKFSGGVFIDSTTNIQSDVNISDGDLYVSAPNSGVFQGNLQTFGTIYQNSVPVATTVYVDNATGTLGSALAADISELSSALASTGSTLDARLMSTGFQLQLQVNSQQSTFEGQISDLESNLNSTGQTILGDLHATGANLQAQINALGGGEDPPVWTTGDQDIYGVKTFNDQLRAYTGYIDELTSYTGYIDELNSYTGYIDRLTISTGLILTSGENGAPLFRPTGSNPAANNTGIAGQFSWSGNYMYLYNGVKWLRFTGASSW